MVSKERNSFIDYSKFENTVVKDVQILNCINPHVKNIKNRRFNAVCKCGQSRTVRQYDIAHRQKLQCKSCGWAQAGSKKIKEGSGIRVLWWSYNKNAKRRKLDFNLTHKDVEIICSKKCTYCGAPPTSISSPFKVKNKSSAFIHNTIDRIDSDKGYIVENCTAACHFCNIAKFTMTKEDFMNWVKRIYNYNFGGSNE